MSSDSSATSMPYVPQMGAETGYELDESTVPLRVSGFVCLLLGLISAVALLGSAALVVPVLAIVFGLIALRPSPIEGIKPVGTSAAKVGIVLALAFGTCGFLLPVMKTATLGDQAKFFSRRYIEVIARDYDEFAMELNKEYRNRFASTMPLRDFYRNQSEEGQRALEEFKQNGAFTIIRDIGPDGDWVLDRPVRVYHSFGIDRAEVVWRSVQTGQKIQFMMQYLIDGDDVGQWHVDVVQQYRERIVAESIL